MKRWLLPLIGIILWVALAYGYSGDGSIWAQRVGDYVQRNFRGDSTGFGEARDWCLRAGGGVIQVGPGMEAVTLTYPSNANLLVIRAFKTGWSADPNLQDAVNGNGLVEVYKKGSPKRIYAGNETGFTQANDYVGPGGLIKVGPGRYPFAATQVIKYPGVTFEGSGDSTVFYLTAADTILSVADNCDRVTFKNLVLDGNFDYLTSGAAGIAVYNSDRVTLDNVKVRHFFDNGVTFKSGSDYPLVRNCEFIGIGTSSSTQGSAVRFTSSYPVIRNTVIDSVTGFGVFVNNSNNYQIENNTIRFGGLSGGTQQDYDYKGGNIYVDTLSIKGTIRSNYLVSPPGIDNVHAMGDSTLLVNNYCLYGRSSIHFGYTYTAGRGSSIIGNQLMYFSTFGIFVEALNQSMDGLTISDNTIMGQGAAADAIDFESHQSYVTNNVTITNNRIYNAARSGIRLKLNGNGGFKGVSISNNDIFYPTLHGIEIDQVTGSGSFTEGLFNGNRIVGAGSYAVFLDNVNTASTVALSNNTMVNCTNNENIGANWSVVGVAKNVLRVSRADVNDSLRVRGLANFDQGAFVTGNSWVAGHLSVGDSLRVNKVANFDQGVQATGNSWVSGRMSVGDSLRVNKISNFDQSIQVTGNSWVSGKLQVSDSTRTRLALVSDTLRTRKLTVQDSLRVTNLAQVTGYTFANLPSPANNGLLTFCIDCTKSTPCAGSGTGAFAYRTNGTWDCMSTFSTGDTTGVVVQAGRTNGQTALGSNQASSSASTYLALRGYNNATSSGAGLIKINQDINVEADNFSVAERGQTTGLNIATGTGFNNTSHTGSITETGHASASGPPLFVDHGGAGLTQRTLVVKGAASQTGQLTEWDSPTGTIIAQINPNGAFWTNASATIKDSLVVAGKYHTIGTGGTTDGDTTSIVLNGTSSTTGLAQRSPKINFLRNGTSEGTIAAYAGGLEMRFQTGDRLVIGNMATTAAGITLHGDGRGVFGDSVTSGSNFVPTNYFHAPTGKGFVGEGTAGIFLSNTGGYYLKDTGGADQKIIHTSGGTNILRISPLASGAAIDFLNYAGTANVTVQDNGVLFLSKTFTFATLPTAVNGGMIYCSDCKSVNDGAAAASAAASGGTGVILLGYGSAWRVP